MQLADREQWTMLGDERVSHIASLAKYAVASLLGQMESSKGSLRGTFSPPLLALAVDRQASALRCAMVSSCQESGFSAKSAR